MGTFYCYIDRTADAGMPFYVGKGNGARVKGVRRNPHHQHIVGKHELQRDIVLVTGDEQQALSREVELIAELHTFVDDPLYNGIGCNYTPGGEGHTPTRAERDRQRARMTERWANPVSSAVMRVAMKGKTGVYDRSATHRQHQSVAISGANNHNYGKSPSSATRAKIRTAKLGKPSKLKGKKLPDGAMAKKWKRVLVTSRDGTTREFPSYKETAKILATELGLAYNTVAGYVSARPTKPFHGLTFTYPGKT